MSHRNWSLTLNLGPLWESHHGLRWKVVAATFMNIEDVWYIWPLSKMVSYNKNHWAFSHPAVKWGTFDHLICGYPEFCSIGAFRKEPQRVPVPIFPDSMFFFWKRLYRLYIWLDLQPAMWFCWMGMCFTFLWNCFFCCCLPTLRLTLVGCLIEGIMLLLNFLYGAVIGRNPAPPGMQKSCK